MSRHILSIDLRNKAVAYVLMNSGLKSNVVIDAGYVPYPEEPGDEDPLVQTLRTVCEQTAGKDTSVVAALPGDRAFYRNIRVPFRETKKITQVLPFELEPHLPLPIDELVIDFQKGGEGRENDLLAIALSSRELQRYQQLFAENGMKSQLIVPGSFPLAATLLSCTDHLPEQALVLIADHEKSELFIVIGGRICAVRLLPSGFGDEPSLELFALRVRQTLTSFADIFGTAFSPEQVFAGGPALRSEKVVRQISQALDLPATLIDIRQCLGKVEFSNTVFEWNGGQMDNALSLAFIESQSSACPSFHRSGSALRNYWSSYKSYVKTPAILLAFVLTIGLAGVFADISMLQSRVDRIDAQMESLFADTFPGTKRVGVDAIKQMESELKKLGSAGFDLEQGANPIRNIDVLNEISKLIPKNVDVLFKRYHSSANTVTLSGETSAFTIVDDIKVRLQKSPLFKEITIASANMDKAGKTVRFQLKVTL